MLSPRLVASLRHLCSLGLPGEIVVPQFLEALEGAIPSDYSYLFWVDEAGMPYNYFGELDGGREKYFLYFLENMESLELYRFAGKSATFRNIQLGNEAVLIGSGADRHRYRASTFYNEIARTCGGRYILKAPVRDAVRVRAGIGLWRDAEGIEFSTREKACLESLTPYLCYALNVEGQDDIPLVEDDNRGIALLERNGRLVRMDERAERLLFLAAYPQIDRSPLRRFAEDFSRPVADMCRNLVRMFEGDPSPPPQLYHHNRWGTFGFRAHWLQRPEGSADGLVAVAISLHIPKKLKLWQGVRSLDLSPRQQEVCLQYAEGSSLTRIAQRLNISRHTAIDHLRKIYERLDIAPNRQALLARLAGK